MTPVQFAILIATGFALWHAWRLARPIERRNEAKLAELGSVPRANLALIATSVIVGAGLVLVLIVLRWSSL